VARHSSRVKKENRLALVVDSHRLACADGVAPTYIGATNPDLTSPVANIIRYAQLSVKRDFIRVHLH